YASSPKTKIYNNKIGNVKELTMVDSETSKAIKKVVCNYDSNGILQEKTFYIWSETQGWIGSQKYSYEYNDGKLDTVVYNEWNKNIAAWSGTQHLVYTYDTDGEFLATRQVENLMAAK
ncbi:MAG: hypothetical protein LBU84_13050, partial [Prevotella sp.]|nr:hypothetical protein [Prevotella sp.]